MLKQIPRAAVYVALFLIPLFTLPFTSNTLDFQKQFLLFLATSIGLVFWAWDAVNEKKLQVNLNPLHLFVAAFATIVFVSSIFSLYRYGSLWGWPLPVAESAITLLSLVFLYFLIVNNFKKNELHKPIAALSVSATIAAVYAIIQSFGEAIGFYLLPFLSYTKTPSFNTIGTTNSLSIFAAIVLATIFPLAFISRSKYSRLLKWCAGIIFFALVFFNGILTVYFPSKATVSGYDLSVVPWIVLAVSALAVFIFSISDQKFLHKNANAKNASFVLLLVTLLFLVFNISAKNVVGRMYADMSNALGIRAATEASLSQSASADIAVSTLKQSAQNFFLGSGPGTFNYDYIKFKPEKINQDNMGWQLTFFSAVSEFINRVATTGLLGIIALLLIIVAWTIEGFRMLTDEETEVGLPLAIFAGWLGVVVAMFYYPFNVSLAMLFWFFLGAIVVMDEKKMFSLPLRSVRMNYAVSLSFVALVALEMGLLVWTSKHYYAEVQYLGAVTALQNQDTAAAIAKMEAAADATDRLQDNYLVGLAQIYLAQAETEASKSGKENNNDNQAAINAALPYLEGAVKTAMQSTEAANPNSSTNWAARGYIYRRLIGVSEGFDTWALDMYNKALQLEPSNPALWNEIGQVYVMKNDLDKAKESFKKATDLRDQYIDPHYYLALINDRQGDKQSAIAELQKVAAIIAATNPGDTASIDNINKAIDNLRAGKSLSGQDANEAVMPAPVPQATDAGQGIPVIEGTSGTIQGTSGQLSNPAVPVAPETRVPRAPQNSPDGKPVQP